MRLGVLDVGSNTVHLLVVDAHPGAPPVPAHSEKAELRLAELSRPNGAIGPAALDRLVETIGNARAVAKKQEVDELLAFATSALRDAPDSADVIAAIGRRAKVELEVLSGTEEARLTFLAVRRWSGWSAGRLMVLDIGGGSLEVAVGTDEEPYVAESLPVGAGVMTRGFLASDPPRGPELGALRRHVREQLVPLAARMRKAPAPHRVAGTSKTFRTLARLAGAAPSSAGPLVPRRLTHGQVVAVLNRVARMPTEKRAALDGLSASRATQIVAGAVVADVAMEALGVDGLEICPWALREGVILRRLDWLSGG